jgi:predicted enzyme related to lactoylglutathione lyase
VRIEAAGGKVMSEKFHIPTAGWLIHFVDTEGALAGAMQYEAGHA